MIARLIGGLYELVHTLPPPSKTATGQHSLAVVVGARLPGTHTDARLRDEAHKGVI
jgi:hypothetical protein